jgi:hypothetical protein
MRYLREWTREGILPDMRYLIGEMLGEESRDRPSELRADKPRPEALALR